MTQETFTIDQLMLIITTASDPQLRMLAEARLKAMLQVQ